MIVSLVIVSAVTIVFVLFYDKKGSIKEMERYYQVNNSSKKDLSQNKKSEKPNV